MRNKAIVGASLVWLVLSALLPGVARGADESVGWPETTVESRPWTYWWWMGSAVEKEELCKNLDMLEKAGLGGVHIIPIYGAKGHEDMYIDFLSDRWMEMFAFTVKEARSRGMGVDMSGGTGWPFGGPQISPEHAAKTFELTKRGGEYELAVKNTGQEVKRAAPGGRGLVMDHFSKDALSAYLARFNQAFAKTGPRPRSFYSDSFEVYGADWTDEMFEEFKRLRGYDLRRHLAALDGKGDKGYVSRVMCDYQETVSDLLLDNFSRPFTEWAREQGALTRIQAHGSPGNLLDLYAAADIPETEAFGPSHFDIPGLEYYKSLPEHRGRPNALVMKFASSAAHVSGKKLVSSESCTWLNEHFTVSPAHVKPEIDKLWAGGINHVFFHGTTYSPTYEDWPGWLFYAPVNFGPTNTWFRDLPALNAYISRTQAFLQKGRPDNDVLLYWPVHDLWSGVYEEGPFRKFTQSVSASFKKLLQGKVGGFSDGMQSAVVELYNTRQSKVKLLAVHNADDWLHRTAFGKTARLLYEEGHTFDYVSDRMISGLSFDGKIVSEGGDSYRAIVVPRLRHMPVKTLEKLAGLSREGAVIIYAGGFPTDVPGLCEHKKRREELRKAIEKADGKNTMTGGDLGEMLSAAGIHGEPLADHGLSFVRRSHIDGHYYFITNPGKDAVDGPVEFATRFERALIFDTMHKHSGLARLVKRQKEESRVYLQLGPGQSLILKTFREKKVPAKDWPYFKPSGGPLAVSGPWRVEFISGGPQLPENYVDDKLAAWTSRRQSEYQYFSGTARYTTSFDLPEELSGRQWLLKLGNVHESARVFINGKEAGTLFCRPFSLRVGEYLHGGHNSIAVEVTNLSANRIIYLDRRLEKWKEFHDINFVNTDYLPFYAGAWRPFRSGLEGPVLLVPSGSD